MSLQLLTLSMDEQPQIAFTRPLLTTPFSFHPSDFEDSTTAKKDPRIGKRKPEVDLTTIADPAERRKQRRLAKNRATAATSRCE